MPPVVSNAIAVGCGTPRATGSTRNPAGVVIPVADAAAIAIATSTPATAAPARVGFDDTRVRLPLNAAWRYPRRGRWVHFPGRDGALSPDQGVGMIGRRGSRAGFGLVVVAMAAGLGLAGCGSPGVGDVESKLATEFPKEAKKQGADITLTGDVACPKDASVKKGSKFTCTVPATQAKKNVVITIAVEMIASDKFNYNIAKIAPGAATPAQTTTN
jgi:hypothetical protein